MEQSLALDLHCLDRLIISFKGGLAGFYSGQRLTNKCGASWNLPTTGPTCRATISADRLAALRPVGAPVCQAEPQQVDATVNF